MTDEGSPTVTSRLLERRRAQRAAELTDSSTRARFRLRRTSVAKATHLAPHGEDHDKRMAGMLWLADLVPPRAPAAAAQIVEG